MKTTKFILIVIAGLISGICITSCSSSSGRKGDIVLISKASDVCPDMVCPVGTKIVYRSGNLFGTVVESSATMDFPGSGQKPGMKVMKGEDPNGRYIKVDTEAMDHWHLCIEHP